MWFARYWVWTNKTKLNREFPSLLIYFSLNVPVAWLILNQNLQDRHYGLCLTPTPHAHIEYMKTQLDFLLRDFLFHRDSLRRIIFPFSTSSCSSGEMSKPWLAISCSNFSFWRSISISKCYLFQKARSDFEDAIASLILIIMEFLHDSFERNRVLECEDGSQEWFEHDRVWAGCWWFPKRDFRSRVYPMGSISSTHFHCSIHWIHSESRYFSQERRKHVFQPFLFDKRFGVSRFPESEQIIDCLFRKHCLFLYFERWNARIVMLSNRNEKQRQDFLFAKNGTNGRRLLSNYKAIMQLPKEGRECWTGSPESRFHSAIRGRVIAIATVKRRTIRSNPTLSMGKWGETGFDAIESTLSLYEIRENSSSEQWRDRSEAADFSSWWRSFSRRSVVQNVSSTLRIKRERERKELWMDFDEVVEDVEGGVESFFVDGRIVLETREIAYKHLGNVFRDLGTRGEK